MFPSNRRVLSENERIYRPFNSDLPKNVLSEYNGALDVPVKVLFLKCSDLANVFRTVSLFPSIEHLELHLVDSSLLSVARNILIAAIASAPDFNVHNEEDLWFLFDVWYNSLWTVETAKRFTREVIHAMSEGLPADGTPEEKQEIKAVWMGWITVLNSTRSEFLEQIDLERRSFVEEHWNRTHNQDQPKIPFHQVIQLLSCQNETDPPEVIEELRRFYESGTCRPVTSRTTPSRANPTLLEPETWLWRVNFSCCPLNWEREAPTQVSPTDTDAPNTATLLDRRLAQLQALVGAFRLRSANVRLFHRRCDPIQFCARQAGVDEFTLIECGDLADEVGLANLLDAGASVLEHSADAVLLTDTATWSTLASSLLTYVETALCCPLSMTPTLYGLRLTNRVTLGHDAPFDVNRMSTAPAALRWQRPPACAGLRLLPSASTRDWIGRLHDTCFIKSALIQASSMCGMTSYTPMTAARLVRSLARRLNWNVHQVDRLVSTPETDAEWRLAWNSCRAWLAGSALVRLSSTKPVSDRLELRGAPPLRVAVAGRQEHFLDNFGLQWRADEVTLELILSLEHGVDAAAGVVLTDLLTSKPILDFGSLGDFQVDTVDWTDAEPAPSAEVDLLDCVESRDEYRMEFQGSAEVDLVEPAECSHQVTFKGGGDAPAPVVRRVTFSCPVVDAAALGDAGDRHGIVLKKAMLEPWPCDWNDDRGQWDVHELPEWTSRAQLSIHLSSQFQFRDLHDHADASKSEPASALTEVRRAVQSVFARGVVDGVRCFAVRDARRRDAAACEWLLRVRTPVRVCPRGSPLLVLDAYDHRAAVRLHRSGRLDFATSLQDRCRLLDVAPDDPEAAANDRVAEMLIYTDEEAALFRYVLRSNAARRRPCGRRDAGALLSTFLTPLYVDHPGGFQDATALLEAAAERQCATCAGRRADVRRCARCRAVFYCSVSCQRSDWPRHKTVCARAADCAAST